MELKNKNQEGRCYSPDGRVNPSKIGYSPDDMAHVWAFRFN